MDWDTVWPENWACAADSPEFRYVAPRIPSSTSRDRVRTIQIPSSLCLPQGGGFNSLPALLLSLSSAMQSPQLLLPHWLILAGSAFVLLGSIGLLMPRLSGS